ncbi:hypothetical protein ES706_01417 [subsurface metagenome]
MLEARCPKCGYHCYGPGLTKPEYQTCPICGTKLEIHQEAKLSSKNGRRKAKHKDKPEKQSQA